MTDRLLPQELFDKAAQVVAANRAAGRRIAVAESCTGGLVSSALTEIPGSSDVFEAGFVTYSNASKAAQLKVSPDVVETFGAVSVATAWAMARGALHATEADVAVAITGIAGPGGGTEAKPVGTVCIAVDGGRSMVRTFRFPGGRDVVKAMSANWGIDMLRRFLLEA